MQELKPGHLAARVEGHLTDAVGEAFPVFARDAAKRAERCVVSLDVRHMTGFDAKVRDRWFEVVWSERARIERIEVASSKWSITLAAKAASVALRALGVRLDVLAT